MSRAEEMLGSMFRDWQPSPVTGPQIIQPEPAQRERGASNLSMVELGKHQLRFKGRGFTEQLLHNNATHGRPPDVHIHTSDWDRTKDSANQMMQQMAVMGIRPQLHLVPELAPQSLGELEGQESEKVAPELDKYRNELRDVPPPGISPLTGQKGESTDHYASRVLPVIDRLVTDSAEHPATVHIVSAHSSDMREVRRKYEPGYSGHDHIEPAQTDLIHIAEDGHPRYVPDVTIGGSRLLIPGVYLQHHGATEFNVARPELSALQAILPRKESTPTNPSEGGNASATPTAG